MILSHSEVCFYLLVRPESLEVVTHFFPRRMKSANDDKEVPNDVQIVADITAKSKEVDSLLFKKLKSQALSVSLKNPPAGNKSESIKVRSLREIFSLIDQNELDEFKFNIIVLL